MSHCLPNSREVTRHCQAGFTLTEALIAIAILAGIAAAMAPALQGITRVAARIHTETSDAEDHRITLQVLTRIINGALQLPDTEATTIKGRKSQFSIVSFGYNHNQPRNFQFRIEETDGVSDLLLAEPNTDHNSISLMTGRRFTFSYFGRQTDEPKTKWHLRWQDQALPRLIRFEGFDLEGDAIVFDIDLHAQAPLICRFDAVSRRCREE